LTKESALSKRADDFFRDFPELRDLAQREVFVGVSAVSGSLGNKDAPFKVSLSWEDEPNFTRRRELGPGAGSRLKAEEVLLPATTT
jgi:hypothetical protein